MHEIIQGLYAIADNTFRADLSPADLALEFLRGGCRIIQLRMKSDAERITENAERILQFKDEYEFTFIVNDHIDVALAVGADGVHVGANDMPVAEVRKRVGPNVLIGYSSHSLEEAMAAEKAGADYVAFGAIFSTKTKGPGHPVQGLKKLREIVEAVQIPVVAIGGINKENFGTVLETGVASVAMITALTEAKNIAEATQYYETRFNHRGL